MHKTTKKQKQAEPVIYLKGLVKIDDMRRICWNASWMAACARANSLKPGEGILYINRKHDKLRAVVMLSEPTLILFGTERRGQRQVFSATVDALVRTQTVKLGPLARRPLVTRNWNLCIQTRPHSLREEL